jgi:hypothetical protein
MPGTDFFDDDLVRQRDAPKRISLGPGADDNAAPAAGGEPGPRPVSDLNLTRIARHKQEITEQAAVAAQELDRIRKRQEEIEGEKRLLEDMRKKHEDYDRGKREIVDHLKRSLVALERQEMDSNRMVEVLAVTRRRFKDMLGQLESIQEEAWPEDKVRDELTRHLGLIEEARLEFGRAMAKVEATQGDEKAPGGAGVRSAVLFDDAGGYGHDDRHFGDWMKIGLAVSLPIIVTLVVLTLVFLLVRSSGLI